MIRTEQTAADVDVYEQLLWGTLIFAQLVVDNQMQWYIPECLYSRHNNGVLYAIETAVLVRAV